MSPDQSIYDESIVDEEGARLKHTLHVANVEKLEQELKVLNKLKENTEMKYLGFAE